jgi:hypothetical protein
LWLAVRDRRLKKLAIDVLTALGERDATIAATEQRASAALQAMITDEHLTVTDAVHWCAGPISHREVGRLRRLTGGRTTTSARITARPSPAFDDSGHGRCEDALRALSAITATRSQRASWGVGAVVSVRVGYAVEAAPEPAKLDKGIGKGLRNVSSRGAVQSLGLD